MYSRAHRGFSSLFPRRSRWRRSIVSRYVGAGERIQIEHAPLIGTSFCDPRIPDSVMDACMLRPPNSHFLSDDIVRGAVLRPKRTERGGVANMDNWFIADTELTRIRDGHWSSGSLGHAIGGGVSRTGNGRRQLSLKDGASVNESDVAEQITSERWRVREMRRMRQIRYRKKKENHANTVEEEARGLREEVKKLQQRRRSASAATSAKESVWNVATEYFRLFRYGLQSTATHSSANEPSVQQDFLLTVMAADVVFSAGSGPESMAKSWKCLSMWFQDVELELEDMHKGAADSLVTSTTTSVTITERTLRNVFPHLSRGGEAALAEKLLNQRIVMRGVTRFEWDAAYGRVKGVFSQADMLTPMLRLLGNLEDVSCVFDKALITPDFQWRSQVLTW